REMNGFLSHVLLTFPFFRGKVASSHNEHKVWLSCFRLDRRRLSVLLHILFLSSSLGAFFKRSMSTLLYVKAGSLKRGYCYCLLLLSLAVVSAGFSLSFSNGHKN